MPTYRKDTGHYYVQRNFPGVGHLYKSLHTRSKSIARRREDALLSLHQQGRHELVRAFDHGDVSIHAIQEAYESGRVHELVAELRRGTASLAAACKAALDHKAPDVAASTLERYGHGLDHLRAFHGDDTDVATALSEDAIQRFKGHRLDEGAAEQTVNNDLGAVSILVTYALRKGWIDERPEIKRFSYKARIRWLDRDELALYLASLRPAFVVQMQLLVGTGMRLGESEGLRVCDLRFGGDDSRAMIDDSKTSTGVRTVFVPRWAAEAVAEHVAEHDLHRTDRVFFIERRTVRDEHNRACKLAGIPEYTIHDHRHTAAVHLARAGMPLHLLQQQLGHKNIEMTMKYSRFHPDYSDVADYFDRVGAVLGLDRNNDSNNAALERAPEEAEL